MTLVKASVLAALTLLLFESPVGAQTPGGGSSGANPVVTAAESIRIGAWIQPAWSYEGISDAPDRSGFFLRRARLDLTGSARGGNLRFRLLPDLARSPELRDAWVELRGLELSGLTARIRMGQQTVPFDLKRERDMAYAHFGERPVAARRFELNGGRDVGVVGMLEGWEGRFVLQGGTFNGEGPNRSQLGQSPLLSGRATLTLGGTRSNRESDRDRTRKPVVTLGAGAMGASDSFLRPRPGFAVDRAADWRSWTLDLHTRWRGASVSAGWFDQAIDSEEADVPGEGYFLSGGWLLPGHDVEVAVRHSRAVWDENRDLRPDRESSIGVTFLHGDQGLQTRIQFSRETSGLGGGTLRRIQLLTVEHQLLLGG